MCVVGLCFEIAAPDLISVVLKFFFQIMGLEQNKNLKAELIRGTRMPTANQERIQTDFVLPL